MRVACRGETKQLLFLCGLQERTLVPAQNKITTIYISIDSCRRQYDESAQKNRSLKKIVCNIERRPAVIQLYRNWICTTYAQDWDVAQDLGRPAPALDNPADQARRRLSLEDYN